MNASWRSELWRILAIAAASLVAAVLTGAPLAVACLALAGYLSWHVYQAAGLVRWLASGDPVASPPRRLSGVWYEIHDRIRFHLRALVERNALLQVQMGRYRQVARALPDAAVMFSRRGGIELINDAAHNLLGLREPEDLGQPLQNLIRLPRFLDYLEEERFDMPLEIPSPADPGITLSVMIIAYGEHDRYLLLARDTSRLHRLEHMRRDFVANVSHEMKSPLTVIKGYVEHLIDDPATFQRWNKPLTQIDQQADRMRSIVEDLLALSDLETRPAPRSLQSVDIPALIRSVIAEASELSQGRHRIESGLDEDLWITGAPDELYSAFSNVVFNAVSYTESGGTISIRWQRQSGGEACYSVTDTGIGIPPEHVPRLTERFYRVDQARSRELGGTGLGLAIVKHVLMRHHGRLEVDSEVGQGSTFTFMFPAVLVQSRPEAASRSGHSAA